MYSPSVLSPPVNKDSECSYYFIPLVRQEYVDDFCVVDCGLFIMRGADDTSNVLGNSFHMISLVPSEVGVEQICLLNHLGGAAEVDDKGIYFCWWLWKSCTCFFELDVGILTSSRVVLPLFRGDLC